MNTSFELFKKDYVSAVDLLKEATDKRCFENTKEDLERYLMFHWCNIKSVKKLSEINKELFELCQDEVANLLMIMIEIHNWKPLFRFLPYKILKVLANKIYILSILNEYLTKQGEKSELLTRIERHPSLLISLVKVYVSMDHTKAQQSNVTSKWQIKRDLQEIKMFDKMIISIKGPMLSKAEEKVYLKTSRNSLTERERAANMLAEMRENITSDTRQNWRKDDRNLKRKLFF
jgi:hypothetical protein